MDSITYKGTVYPWQCDHIGHMNIMWYVSKFDEANWNFFATLGLTPHYCASNTAAWQRSNRTFPISANCWPAISWKCVVVCSKSEKRACVFFTKCGTSTHANSPPLAN